MTGKEKWQITIALEGMPLFAWKPFKLQVDGIEIQLRRSADDGKDKPMASVEIETDEPEMIKILAFERIDKVLAKISFALGRSVTRTNEKYYLQLEPKSDAPKYDWGWQIHRTMMEGEAFAVADYENILNTTLARIANLSLEKRAVFNKAAALYREALSLENPNVALIIYFSSITPVVRDTLGVAKVTTEDLKRALQQVSTMEQAKFSDQFDRMYGNVDGRSAVDHGWADITDPLTFGNATMYVNLMMYWTRSLIRKYVDDNQPKL
ncbi:hypothetical protein [Nitrososphaera sp.]|uniref:hypothetical protein n=1 Tax=Nitrososphaera sp. TaxID=1971748 RepID=UPI002EDB793C